MLDLEVVAEGIETQDHLELLRSMGCEFAQGYFLGKPMSAAAFRNRLLSALIPKSPPFAWSTGLRGTQAPAGWRAQKLNSEGFGL
jgi:predicted signal transduction protein with EAL and GGDEF domain